MESERRGAAHSAIISLSLIDEAEEKINKGESVKKGIEWRRMIKQQSWVSITYIHHLSQTAKWQTAEGTVQHKQEVMLNQGSPCVCKLSDEMAEMTELLSSFLARGGGERL